MYILLYLLYLYIPLYICYIYPIIYIYVIYIYIFPYIYMLYVYNTYSLSVHLGRHLSCFHMLASVNYTAINIRMNVSFQSSVFIFFIYTRKSGISDFHIVVLFSIL